MDKNKKSIRRDVNSDVLAKEWYEKQLINKGYSIISHDLVDIVAEKDGVRYYYEVKSQNKTRRKNEKDPKKSTRISIYTGHVSLKQLQCALENEEHFRYVFLRRGAKVNGEYTYYGKELTLEELLTHLTGSWSIERNFYFSLKDFTPKHPDIKQGSRTDTDTIRREISNPLEILKTKV